MSCISNLNNIETDEINCNGMIMSNEIPSHQMTRQEEICLGINLPEKQELIQDWENGKCQAMINEMVYPDDEYSEQGFKRAVNDYNYLFYSYYGPKTETNINGGHTINEDDDFSRLLINSCSETHGVCQCVSFNMCKDCGQDEIYDNKLTRRLCGCFCNDSDPCDFTCASKNTSKFRDYEFGQVKECKDEICNVIDTDIGSFVDICPKCRGDSCACYSDKILPSSFRSVCNNRSNVRYDDEDFIDTESYNVKYFMFIFAVFLLVMIIFVMAKNEEKINEDIKIKSDPVKKDESVKIKYDKIFKETNVNKETGDDKLINDDKETSDNKLIKSSKTIDLYEDKLNSEQLKSNKREKTLDLYEDKVLPSNETTPTQVYYNPKIKMDNVLNNHEFINSRRQ